MNEENSYSMAEMAKRDFELPFGSIFSFKQLYQLKKVKKQVDELWKEHRSLWNYLEKLRIYAQLAGKENEWESWKEQDKFSFVGFQKPNLLRDQLRMRICVGCGDPYAANRPEQKYCTDNCRQKAFQRKKKTILTHT